MKIYSTLNINNSCVLTHFPNPWVPPHDSRLDRGGWGLCALMILGAIPVGASMPSVGSTMPGRFGVRGVTRGSHPVPRGTPGKKRTTSAAFLFISGHSLQSLVGRRDEDSCERENSKK